MTVDWNDTTEIAKERQRAQWRKAQQRRRARFYAAGLTFDGQPPKHGPQSRSNLSHRKERFKGGR